jgi:hypothetical protein
MVLKLKHKNVHRFLLEEVLEKVTFKKVLKRNIIEQEKL